MPLILLNDDVYARDGHGDGHGHVDVYRAIEESCDTYFYDLSHRMKVDDLHDFLWQFGFGRRISLDVAEAVSVE